MQPTELTPIQQAKCAKSWERYNRIYSEIEFETRCAWESEFGGNPAFPFVPHGPSIHREAQRRVELEQRHEAEDRPEYVASGLY